MIPIFKRSGFFLLFLVATTDITIYILINLIWTARKTLHETFFVTTKVAETDKECLKRKTNQIKHFCFVLWNVFFDFISKFLYLLLSLFEQEYFILYRFTDYLQRSIPSDFISNNFHSNKNNIYTNRSRNWCIWKFETINENQMKTKILLEIIQTQETSFTANR